MKPKFQSLRSSFLPTHIALSLGLAVAGLSTHSAQAANLTWDSDAIYNNGTLGGTGTWDTSLLNWDNGTADAAWATNTITGDTAVFGGTSGTVTLGASAINALGLKFTTTSYTIALAGNTLALGTGGIDATALTSGTTTISGTGGVGLAGNQTWDVGSGATLAISSGISSSTTGTKILTVQGAGNTTVSGAITAGSGVMNLVKFGTGTLTLSGGGALGTGGITNGNSGATLSAVLLGGTTKISSGTYTSTSEFVVGGVLSNGGAGVNTNFTMDGGSLTGSAYLSLGRGNGTGSVSSDIVLNNSATITAANFSAGFNGGNASNLPKGTFTLNNTSGFTISGNGVYNLAESGGSNMTMTLNDSATLTVSGSGNKFIGNGGTGTLTLNGTSSANLGTGLIAIGQQNGSGTLNVNTGATFTSNTEIRVAYSGSNGSFSGSGTINVNGGTLNTSSLTVGRNNNDVASTLNATVNVSNGGTLNVTNGGTLVGWRGIGTNATVNISGGSYNQGTTATANMTIGSFAGATGAVNVSGTGTLTFQNNSNLRFSDTANANAARSLTISGGNVTFYSNAGSTVGGTGVIDLMLTSNPTGTSTINLDGGTLTANQIKDTSATGTRVINFNGGTLKTASSGSASTFLASGVASTANVRNGGAIIDTNGINTTIGQALVHSTIGGDTAIDGGLTKNNAGTLTLSGANTYTGATTISAGTLQIGTAGSLGSGTYAGNIANAGALQYSSSAAQTLSGIISGVGTLTKDTSSTSTLTLSGTNTYTGVTTLGAGTLSVATIGNGGVAGNLGQATNAAGNLVFDGGTLQYTGSSATSDRAFTINAGKTATIDTANNISFAGATGTATTGALTKLGAGTLTLTGANTFTGTTTISVGTLQIGGTGSLGSGTYAGNIANSGALQYSSSATQTLSGIISGVGTLTKDTSSTSTLTLSNAGNLYTGSITINGGTLAASGGIGNPGTATSAASTLGDIGTSAGARSITVNNGGTLSMITGNILGTGGSTNGLSNITLNVNQGGVFQTGSNVTGSGWWNKIGAVNLDGGTIHVGSGANNTSFQGLALIGTVTVGGSSTTASTIDNISGSDATMNGVHLGQNGSTTITFNVADVTGSAASDLNVSAKLINSSNALGAASGIIKTGLGTMTLSGANTYTGGTTVNGGALIIGSSGSLASGNALTVGASGTAEFANAGQTLGAVSNANTATNALNFSASTGTVTLASLSGSGNTRFGSNGTVTGGISTGTVNAVGLLTADISGGTVGAGSLSAGTVSDGTTTITGAAGITTLSNGTTTVGGVATIGTMSAGTANLNGATSAITTLNGGTVNLGSTTVLTVSNGTTSGAITGTGGSLTKDTSGTLTLSGTNTYTGATNVNNGTLVVNGSTATASTVTVSSGATLKGSGTVGGNTTISGTHAPGAVGTPGQQTFSGTLTYNSGSIFEWDLNAATTDPGANTPDSGTYGQVAATGAVSGTSAFKVVLGTNSFTDAFWDTNKTWTNIFTGAGVTSGTLASLFGTFDTSTGVDATGNVAGQGYFTFTPTGNTLSWTAVPEPTSALAGLLLGAGLLRRRRK